MKAYKGFNKDMTCRGFQFEEGKTYEEEKAVLCNSGFHACENPLDCLNYYSPDKSVYHEVDLDDVSDERQQDSKVCGKRITIGARLDFAGMVKGAISFVFEKVKATTGDWAHAATTGDEAHAATTGNWAHAATTGYRAHAATTGDWAHAATTGYRAHAATAGNEAHAATTGYRAHAATTGDWAHAATTGDEAHAATTGYRAHAATAGNEAHAATTGDWAHAATTGNWAHAATTGNWAHAATTGYRAHAEAKGKNSIAAALGFDSSAKAALGCWIVCSEYDNKGNLKEVKAVKVDGETIKADTLYRLKDGDFVEVK